MEESSLLLQKRKVNQYIECSTFLSLEGKRRIKQISYLLFLVSFFHLESCDIIYLAPEIEEEDVDTEKVMW